MRTKIKNVVGLGIWLLARPCVRLLASLGDKAQLYDMLNIINEELISISDLGPGEEVKTILYGRNSKKEDPKIAATRALLKQQLNGKIW